MTRWDVLTGDGERDRRNVQILMDSVAELYGPHGVDELMRRAVDRAILVTGAEEGILLLDDGGQLIPTVARDAHGRDVPLTLEHSRTVVEKVWDTGKPHLLTDATGSSPRDVSKSMLALKILSVMGVPLTVSEGSLGVLYVHSTLKVKEFTEADFHVFQAVGGLIALAVRNSRLLAERVERERMAKELALAQTIQQGFLPKDLAVPTGYDMAGYGRPCQETSGDYYDVIPLSDGRIFLVIGDVSGHGLGPALFMASTRAQLHALLRGTPEATDVLQTVNAFLARDMEAHQFMSLFLGVLDPAAHTFHYASAGHHPSPLLLRASGEVTELEKTGPILSVIEDAAYEASDPIDLATGDSLFLYTDGIYEARGSNGDLFGENGFMESLAGHLARSSTCQGVVDGVIADMESFCAGSPRDDDTTCLVLRVL